MLYISNVSTVHFPTYHVDGSCFWWIYWTKTTAFGNLLFLCIFSGLIIVNSFSSDFAYHSFLYIFRLFPSFSFLLHSFDLFSSSFLFTPSDCLSVFFWFSFFFLLCSKFDSSYFTYSPYFAYSPDFSTLTFYFLTW